MLVDGVFDDWRLRDLLLLGNNDFLAVFFTLLLPMVLFPWASVPLRDVSLGFVHLVKSGDEGIHVAEVPEHDGEENEWSTELVGGSVMWLLVMATVVLSAPSLMSAVMFTTSVVLVSSHHTHELWLLIILLFWFVAKVAARENGWWKFFGISDWSASCFNGSTLAPRAITGMSVALILGGIFAGVILIWVFTSHELGPLADDSISQLFVMFALMMSLWMSWGFLGVAFEDGGWELSGIGDREAGRWDGGAGTPNAVWVSIAFTLSSMRRFAFFRGLATESDVVIELKDGFWRGFLLLNWSFFFSVAVEDSGWELGSIINGEARRWNGRAGAPDAGWIGVACTFSRVLRLAFIRSLANSDVVVEFLKSFWGGFLLDNN